MSGLDRGVICLSAGISCKGGYVSCVRWYYVGFMLEEEVC